jgi:hypothetical protein
MTVNCTRTPPRLGLALLERLDSRNEALAGDLVEGFQRTRSHVWFWRQLLWAIVTGGFRRPPEIRPLRLVDSPSWQPAATDFGATGRALHTHGLGASPIEGVGGIGIAALVLLTVLVNPSALAIVAVGVLLGIALGLARVVLRRRTASAGTSTRVILIDTSSPASRRTP